jgi:CRP/FNR family cyclic AMP-dependent transcriptional regulator
MKRHHYHDHLRSIPLFEDLDQHELAAVGRAITELDLPAGRQPIVEGTRGHDMFVVIEGELEVTRAGRHVADIGVGEFVGEMALLTGDVRNATVTVTTDAHVLHLDGRALSAVINDTAQVAAKMLPIVARRAADNSSLALA